MTRMMMIMKMVSTVGYVYDVCDLYEGGSISNMTIYGITRGYFLNTC